MGFWSLFSYSAETRVNAATGEQQVTIKSTSVIASVDNAPSSSVGGGPSIENTQVDAAQSALTEATVTSSIQQKRPPDDPVVALPRKFWRLGFVRKRPTEHKAALSTIAEHEKRGHVREASARHTVQKIQMSKSEKRAQKSAMAVRSLIIGPTSSAAAPKMTPTVAKPQLSKIRSQLKDPKSANKLIAQLRQLPASGDSSIHSHTGCSNGPIHAVCLEHSEAEEDHLHFAKLQQSSSASSEGASAPAAGMAGVTSAPVDKLADLFSEMQVVDLVKSPDLGLGQPGNGKGLLAGALPTAETVLEGVRKITPELMALGYATGKVIAPDHSGIYPPTDRMSVLTYWWGLEVLLPPPSLEYLASVQSVTGTVINFLSALALVNNGVREILPFVRYIAQFIDFEFNAIKKQDQGSGVVCAATWIMPAALVPRPWDFPLPPTSGPLTDPPTQADKPEGAGLPPSHGVVIPPVPLPKPMNSLLDVVTNGPLPVETASRGYPAA
ncbi:hypothetical protein NLJ89_g657 [Agrocybe chaxingu]|uniref:Uncharacterized protein n=1 Tax=Agrocybe chaxingu TaxID=84603 RepID=A0A9W8N1J2_9AGAR|nr:hypothetical protein NLJ89_g657 [Agrocybe chaxingu]